MQLLSLDYDESAKNRQFRRRVWFRSSFWAEALIFLIQPIPYYDILIPVQAIDINNKTTTITVWYLLSDFLLVFMWLRIYFVVRAIFNYNRFTDVHAKKLCKSYGFTANVRFTFKSMLKTDPALTVAVTLFGSVLVLAYLLMVFESPYYYALG
jgi:hypothetical protein